MPGRPDALCRGRRHSARHALVQAHGRAAALGDRGAPPGFKEDSWNRQWYGIRRFFAYLETKAYKMHIRVLLSKYRSYTPCPSCAGARLKTEPAVARGRQAGCRCGAGARAALAMPQGVDWSREQLEALPGLCLHDLMLLPIERLRRFCGASPSPAGGRGQGGWARSWRCARSTPHPTPPPGGRGSKYRGDTGLALLHEGLPPASNTCATSASAISRWIGKAARCRAARCSALT